MKKPRKIQATPGANAEHRGSEGPNPVFPAADVKGEVLMLSTSGKPPSKQQELAALIVRDEGATLDQMVAATGWLPHTTRAALTGLRKKGYVISSDKADGVRTYRGISPE